MHDRAEVNCKEVTRTHKLPTNLGAAVVLHSTPPESLAPELVQAVAGVWGGPLAAEPHIMKRPVKAVLLDAQKISIQVATWERAASLKLLSSPRASGGRSVSLSLLTHSDGKQWLALRSTEIDLADSGHGAE